MPRETILRPIDAPGTLTSFLERWRDGTPEPDDDRLMQGLYNGVRRIARARLRDEHRRPMQTTELANECFLRLLKGKKEDWRSRRYFFSIVGRVLRQVLVDAARHEGARKRTALLVPVDDLGGMSLPTPRDQGRVDFLILDEALSALGSSDSIRVQVVELRWLVGLTIRETSEVLGIAPSTVKVHWKLARDFLSERLAPPTDKVSERDVPTRQTDR